MGDVLKADLLVVGFFFIWHNTISCNELMTGSNLFFFSIFLAFSTFSLLCFCVCVTPRERGEGGEGKRPAGHSFSTLFFSSSWGTSDKYKQDLDDLKII